MFSVPCISVPFTHYTEISQTQFVRLKVNILGKDWAKTVSEFLNERGIGKSTTCSELRRSEKRQGLRYHKLSLNGTELDPCGSGRGKAYKNNPSVHIRWSFWQNFKIIHTRERIHCLCSYAPSNKCRRSSLSNNFLTYYLLLLTKMVNAVFFSLTLPQHWRSEKWKAWYEAALIWIFHFLLKIEKASFKPLCTWGTYTGEGSWSKWFPSSLRSLHLCVRVTSCAWFLLFKHAH